MKNIYVLYNNKFLGNKNQASAAAQALKNKLAESKLEVKIIELDEDKLSETQLKEFTSTDTIIGAGVHGLMTVAKIKSAHPGPGKPVTVLTGHQYFSEFKTLSADSYPDIIGIPQQTLTEEQIAQFKKNSIFVPLMGVPHNVTEQNIQADLKNFKASPPPLTGKFPVGIIFGEMRLTWKRHYKIFYSRGRSQQSQFYNR